MAKVKGGRGAVRRPRAEGADLGFAMVPVVAAAAAAAAINPELEKQMATELLQKQNEQKIISRLGNPTSPFSSTILVNILSFVSTKLCNDVVAQDENNGLLLQQQVDGVALGGAAAAAAAAVDDRVSIAAKQLLSLRLVSHAFDRAFLVSPQHWAPYVDMLLTAPTPELVPIRSRLLKSARHAPWIVLNLTKNHGLGADSPVVDFTDANHTAPAPTALNRQRCTLLSLAVANKNVPLIDLLADQLRCDVNRSWEAPTPLRQAAQVLARGAAAPELQPAALATFRRVLRLRGIRDQLEPVVMPLKHAPGMAPLLAAGARRNRHGGGGWGGGNNRNHHDRYDRDGWNGGDDYDPQKHERRSTLSWLFWRSRSEIDHEVRPKPPKVKNNNNGIEEEEEPEESSGSDEDEENLTVEQRMADSFFEDMPYIYHNGAYISRAPVPRVPLNIIDELLATGVCKSSIEELDEHFDTPLMRVTRARSSRFHDDLERLRTKSGESSDEDEDDRKARLRRVPVPYIPLIRLLARYSVLPKLPAIQSRLVWSVVASAVAACDIEVAKMFIDEFRFDTSPQFPHDEAEEPPPMPDMGPQYQPTANQWRADLEGPPKDVMGALLKPVRVEDLDDDPFAVHGGAAGVVKADAADDENDGDGDGEEHDGNDNDDDDDENEALQGAQEEDNDQVESDAALAAALAAGSEDDDDEDNEDDDDASGDEDDGHDDADDANEDASGRDGSGKKERKKKGDSNDDDGELSDFNGTDNDDEQQQQEDDEGPASLFHYLVVAIDDMQDPHVLKMLELLAANRVKWYHARDFRVHITSPLLRAVACATTSVSLIRDLVVHCNMFRCIEAECNTDMGSVSPLHLSAMISAITVLKLFVEEFGATVDAKALRFANEQTTEEAAECHRFLKANRGKNASVRNKMLKRELKKPKWAVPPENANKKRRAGFGGPKPAARRRAMKKMMKKKRPV